MTRLAASRLNWLEETCSRYQDAAPKGALEYLEGRGLTEETARLFRLGLAHEPPAEHKAYAGRLSIPVIKRGRVVDFRFRCISPDCGVNTAEEDHGNHPKIISTPGARTWLYGTDSLMDPRPEVDLCEGEPDAWTLATHLGLAVVGVPGVDSWKACPWWAEVFEGHTRVRLWAHPDTAGERLAHMVTGALGSRALVVHLEADVNATYQRAGIGPLIDAGGL